MNSIVIRADASSDIGIGHVMRCLALAEAAQQRGFDVHLLYQSCPKEILKKYALIGAETHRITWPPFSSIDGECSAHYAKQNNGHWLILDSYQSTTSFIDAAHAQGLQVLAIDDEGRSGIMAADVIVNQNISAKEDWYAMANETTVLFLGSDYVMLRSDFRTATNTKASQFILVTTGGADDLNISPKIIDRLLPRLSKDERLQLIIGPANPNGDSLAKNYGEHPQVELLENVQDMPARLGQAKLVITGAGSTVWECLSLGVPMITMILADNQRAIAKHLHTHDYAICSGNAQSSEFLPKLEKIYEDFEKNMDTFIQRTTSGRQLIDGLGVFRILDTLLI